MNTATTTTPVALVGPAELTRMLGISRTRLVQLSARTDFPKPYAELTMGKVWSLDEIRMWASLAGRALTSRPVSAPG